MSNLGDLGRDVTKFKEVPIDPDIVLEMDRADLIGTIVCSFFMQAQGFEKPKGLMGKNMKELKKIIIEKINVWNEKLKEDPEMKEINFFRYKTFDLQNPEPKAKSSDSQTKDEE
jgi:hypothetical protein